MFGKAKDTLILLALTLPLGLSAQGDTLQQRTLRNVTVVGYRKTTPVRVGGEGVAVWDMSRMDEMPHIMGNADPLHHVQLLPGVQTNNEYDAGLHIQGSESQHTLVAIDGVPLYNVSHMLGFFSLFNAPHFTEMRLSKSGSANMGANRLGGSLEMLTPVALPDSMSGQLSVGPLSSQATLRLPMGRKAALFLSARNAYLNLLYGKWLKSEDEQFRYSFGDYNATLLLQPSARDQVSLNAYWGFDRMGVDEGRFLVDASLRWGNLLASARWTHRGDRHTTTHLLYTTSYRNRFEMTMGDASCQMPSRLADYGYSVRVEGGQHEFGAFAVLHDIRPQTLTLDGFYNRRAQTAEPLVQRAAEGAAHYTHVFPLGRHTTLKATVKGSGFVNDGGHLYAGLDPTLSVSHVFSPHVKARLQLDRRHQYLFQTGFSSMGLPTEFWMAASQGHKPQAGVGASARLDWELPSRRWSIALEGYCRRMTHQTEYGDDLMSLLNSVYDLDASLLEGDGEAYGWSVTLSKQTGRLTGWLNYAWGRSFRHFDALDQSKRFPAKHERIHEVNAVVNYRWGKHWTTSATMVACSGTPFTAPTAFYLLQSRLVTQYAAHNANRLRAYFRLDLSANYHFRSVNGRGGGLNFSLYNATSHMNDLYYSLKVYNGEFGYRPYHFVMNVLPSVSYFYKF